MGHFTPHLVGLFAYHMGCHRGLIESILSFNIVTWYGNVNSKNRTKLARIVNIATKLIGREQNPDYQSSAYDVD